MIIWIILLGSASIPFIQSEEYNLGFILAEQTIHAPVFRKIISSAIEQFNNNNSNDVQLKLLTKTYDSFSLYGLVDAACTLVSSGVVAVISPDGSNSIGSQADLINHFNIPVISIVSTYPHITNAERSKLLLLSPGDEFQANAILDMIQFYGWREVSIVASDTNYGINGVNSFQQLLGAHSEKIIVKSIGFFSAYQHPDPLKLENTLTNTKRSLSRVIILNCEGRYARMILQKAHGMGMMRNGYIWIVTDGITSNPQYLAFDGFYPSYYEGLIGISPSVDTTSFAFRSFRDQFLSKENITAAQLSPAVVKSYDAIQIAGKALQKYSINHDILPSNSTCNNKYPWNNGNGYFEALKSTVHDGLSGSMSFTHEGLVTKPEYKIVNFVYPGLFVNIGNWTGERGLNMYFDKHSEDTDAIQFLGGIKYHPSGRANRLSGEHLRLGVTVNPPFATMKAGCEDGICWEGITPDIVAELSAQLNFTYEFVESEDKLYGYFDPATEEWNGLIGDMFAEKTDMITMDLSVSSERLFHMVDFTDSFMHSGISLVVKGQSVKENVYFFLTPFSVKVWLMIVVSVIVMSLIQQLFNKLSPFGEYGRRMYATQVCNCENCREKRSIKLCENISFKDQHTYECLVEQATAERGDDMSFYNALWVVGSGFVGQGGDSSPTSPSGRFILFTWWFFVMLITSMYTANLTAFMTLDKIGTQIENAKDLLSQDKYSWGMINQSFVESLLRNNVDPVYREIVDGAVKVSSIEEGVAKVHEGLFVFVDETPYLSYNLMGACDMFWVGSQFQPFDYAFGISKNSPYTTLINAHIIKLRERGYFDELWKKWDRIPEQTGCRAGEIGSDETLQLTTLRGIFFFLSQGTLVSIVLFILEVTVATCNDEYDDQQHTFWSKLSRRLHLKLVDIKTEWFGVLKCTAGRFTLKSTILYTWYMRLYIWYAQKRNQFQ